MLGTISLGRSMRLAASSLSAIAASGISTPAAIPAIRGDGTRSASRGFATWTPAWQGAVCEVRQAPATNPPVASNPNPINTADMFLTVSPASNDPVGAGPWHTTRKGGNSMRRSLLALLAIVFVALPAAVPARASIVINEIMYNSNFTPDCEWVELYNTGPTGLNLTDWYLLDDKNTHVKCYLAGTLGAGQYLVIAADPTIFQARYPTVTNLNVNGFDVGGLGFGLGNSGDQVRLFDDGDVLRDSVAYLASGLWPASPNGTGPSLELVNPALDNTLGSSWLGSIGVGGTPGVVNSVYAANAAPICDNGKRDIELPTATSTPTITVRALDPEGHLAGVALWVDSGAGYVSQAMYDDGLHGDGAAGDSIFGAVIAAKANGTLVKYYAKSTDNLSQSNNWPDAAPADYRAYTVGYVPVRIVVNEIVADNTTGVLDDHGVRDDWMEVYNPGTSAITLGGMYLTDNLSNGNSWEIPAGISIPAGGYQVFWADGADTLLGPLHTNFKFSADGEEVGIFTSRDHGNAKIHGWKFGPVGPNVAVGFKPDYAGTEPAGITLAPEYLATPTPGASNNTSALYSTVCINEFMTTSLGGGIDDWIELYNRGASAYDLSGAYLSDNRNLNTKYQFPSGTTIGAGQYLLRNGLQLGFNLSSGGEVLVLTAPDSISGMDFYDYKQQAPDTSEGRMPDGSSRWAKFATPTPDAHNTGALAVGQGPAAPAGLSGVRVAPNPFVSGTEIRFELGRGAVVTADVFDPSGRRVRALSRGLLGAGGHLMQWNGNDEHGSRAASGLYFVRLSTTGNTKSFRVVLLK